MKTEKLGKRLTQGLLPSSSITPKPNFNLQFVQQHYYVTK